MGRARGCLTKTMTHPNTDHRKGSNPAQGTHPSRTSTGHIRLCGWLCHACFIVWPLPLLLLPALPLTGGHPWPTSCSPNSSSAPASREPCRLSKGSLCNRFNQRGGGFRPTSKGNENAGGNLFTAAFARGRRFPKSSFKPTGRVFRESSASLQPEHVASMNSPEWATLQTCPAPCRGWGWHRSPWAGPSAPLLFVGAGMGFASTSQQQNLAVSTSLERPSLLSSVSLTPRVLKSSNSLFSVLWTHSAHCPGSILHNELCMVCTL